MDIVTFCPFVASKVVWQAHSGTFALTVIVKATFVLQPGTTQLAPEQVPIFERDRFYDDDPRRSVRIPSDVVPYKPRADVLLVGHAYAPGKQPVRSLVTRFVVGEVDKSIEVWCDRAFRVLDGQMVEGKRFTEMPIVWERASGGLESANPVGKCFAGPADVYGMIAIGNLQPLGQFVSKRSDTFVPTCYAPVAPTWPGRTQRLGRLSRSILDDAWNARPLPVDLDPTFFLTAPPDQNVAEIRANERIVLENLHHEHPRLVTSLPGMRPRAIADRATGEREEITLVGDTLLIDTDRSVCTVVWRGRMGLRSADEAGRIAVWVDGMPMGAPVQPRQTVEIVDDAPELETTMVPKASPQAAALPFVSGPSSLAQSSMVRSYARDNHEENDGTTTMSVPMNKFGGKAIPFDHEGSFNSRVEETIPPQVQSNHAIPFGVPSIPEPPVVVADPYANMRMPMVEPVVEESGYKEPVVVNEAVKVEVLVAPPPMIGPLAKVEMPIPDAKTIEPQVSALLPPAPPVEAPKKFNPADFPLERCAALTASIARTKTNKGKLLEAEELTEKQWESIQEYWNEAIKAETRRGKRTLLDRFDEAYVGQLEKERGPITVEEYAKLQAAADYGNQEEVMTNMQIPYGAFFPIQRVWSSLMISNDVLALSVQERMSEQT